MHPSFLSESWFLKNQYGNCVLDTPDLCSVRYISKDKQVRKVFLFKIFFSEYIFLIFLFHTIAVK